MNSIKKHVIALLLAITLLIGLIMAIPNNSHNDICQLSGYNYGYASNQ